MTDLLPDGSGPAQRRVPLPGALGAAAGVAALAALAAWARHATAPAEGLLLLDLVLAVLGGLAVPLLLRYPLAGTLGLTAAATLSVSLTPAASLGVLLVAQRRGLPVAAAAAAAGVAAHAAQGVWRPHEDVSLGWWLALVAVGYSALVGWGVLLRTHRALAWALRERARRAEAEQGRRVAEARMLERTRLAREMHDVLAHRLSLLATYAGALEYRPDSAPEKLAHAAGVVRAGAHQALEELREVIGLLRDSDGAAGPAPVWADLAGLVEESRAAGAQVVLSDRTVEPETLPASVVRTAYRVLQEGLTNARKHAPGQPVRLVLEGRPGQHLVLEVRNRLVAGDVPQSVPGSGTGLVGLTERVRLCGGQLDHGAFSGEFRLCARLAWPA